MKETSKRNQPTAEIPESLGAKFLLAEFSNVSELWRHKDSNNDKAISLYLTISAILVPGTTLAWTLAQNIELVLVNLALVSLGLFVLGLFFANDLVTTYIIKVRYLQALNLIRRYFVEQDTEISQYVTLPTTTTFAVPRFPSGFTAVGYLWTGMMLGLFLSAVLLLTRPALPGVLVVSVAILAAAIVFVALYALARNQFKKALGEESA